MPPSRERRFIEAADSRSQRAAARESTSKRPQPGPPRGPAATRASAPIGRRVSSVEKEQAARRCCGRHRHSSGGRGPAPAWPPARSLGLAGSLGRAIRCCRRRPRSTPPARARGCAKWGRADSSRPRLSSAPMDHADSWLLLQPCRPAGEQIAAAPGYGLLIWCGLRRHDPTMLTAVGAE